MHHEILTRRTALRLVGATAAMGGLSTATSAQQNESEETDDGDAEGEPEQLPIILSGRTEYWYGIAPEEIEGQENPTLSLEEGQEYELVWINVDAAEHELIVESEDGEELEASDSSETAGEAVSMTFEPSQNAAEYYCEYHPETMRGDIELAEGGEALDLSPHQHGEEGGEATEEEGNETNESGTGY